MKPNYLMSNISGYKANGFTLMEVMITVFVFSVGLLGVAGLQSVSLKNNQAAYHRSIATMQVYDMADRLRSNRVGVGFGGYSNISGTGGTFVDCADGTTVCTPQEMSGYDAATWNIDNAALLPTGAGTVVVIPNTAPARFAVVVAWAQKVSNKATATQSMNVSIEVQP